MLVTLSGMVTLVKPCNHETPYPNARNAVRDGHAGQTGAIYQTPSSLMLVTLSGMVNPPDFPPDIE